MNEINVSVSFKKGKCNVYGYNPVDNDYSVSKMIFKFDEEYEGRKVVEIRPEDSSSKEATFSSEIINNEVILTKEVDGEYYSIFTTSGRHIVEVHVYGTNSKITATSDPFYVKEEQIIIGDEQATAYLPIFDQMIQELEEATTGLNNLNIEASKSGKVTSITITKKDGTSEITEVLDGLSMEYVWRGTELGIRIEGESQYQYVDLKGEKGDAGAIKFTIVNELPQTGADDTIYLVPLQTPESQENNYAEYIYVNNAWELLGKIGIHIDLSNYYTKTQTDNLLNGKANTSDIPDLTDYVTNTDYATTSTGGVIIVDGYYGTGIDANGKLKGTTKTYAQYQSGDNHALIEKATLENVITGKDLTTKAYVDGLVGDIATALDTIQGEVI